MPASAASSTGTSPALFSTPDADKVRGYLFDAFNNWNRLIDNVDRLEEAINNETNYFTATLRLSD